MKNFDSRRVKWGDIFVCDIGSTKGSVESGVRPVVVIQTNKLNYSSPTVTVAVITSVLKKPEMNTHIVIGREYGLEKASMIMLEQTRTVDKAKELHRYIGRISDEETISKIKNGLRYIYDLDRQPQTKQEDLMICLCGKCRSEFESIPENIVRRVDPLNTIKEPCDKCQVRYGSDYLITKRHAKPHRDGGTDNG